MPLLEVKELRKNYGKFCAADKVSFEVNTGEIVALIGENGAGKTTILNCVAGNIFPDSGNVIYKNQTLLKENSLLNEFGILIQAEFYDYLNAYDNLKLLLQVAGRTDIYGIDREVNELLSLVGLTSKKEKYVKTFSFGMKQRMGLAQALLNDPQFLILDEPFVGLDPIGKDMLKKVILMKAKQNKAGILFSSHDLEDVIEICDRIVMMDKGSVVYDNVFIPEKKYVLEVNGITGLLKAELEAHFDNKCEISEYKIIFSDIEIFEYISEIIKNNKLHITGINIEENTLYDFFKKR